ncbi:hypothetical protein [Aquitalea magnusonii]|uniref:hypothetical protein n=1 Tax=Aquitalea magnusonii TaxID=332411 RepID=UPI0011B71E63|nr:hypothetical protein [Aquitalea magnusonii]
MQNKFPETLSIQLGETGSELAKRYPTLLDLNKQPAGINFYQLNPIYLKQKVKTIFNLKQYSIEVPFTLSIMGTEDADIPKEGIYAFDINAVFSEKEKIMTNMYGHKLIACCNNSAPKAGNRCFTMMRHA